MEKPSSNSPSNLESQIEEPGAIWDQIPNTQNEVAKESHTEALWSAIIQARENPFPNSTGEANPDMPTNQEGFDALVHHQPYLKKMPGYQFQPEESVHHFIGGDVNVGYKLRLNVALDNIERVSDYLKDKNINHKFLSGADSSGEVFTVYTGSKERSEAIAKLLSTDLDGALCKPVGDKELEFAPNVGGYFVAANNPFGIIKEKGMEFSRYPSFKRKIRGMPLMKIFDLAAGVSDKQAYDVSYNYLSNSFGTYFYGNNETEVKQSKFDDFLKSKRVVRQNEQVPESAFDKYLKGLKK